MGRNTGQIPQCKVMKVLYDVILPSPWWHPLTYKGLPGLKKGQRVSIPVGNGQRIGIVLGKNDSNLCLEKIEIKEIYNTIDKSPSIPEELLDSIIRAGKFFCCGPGELLKVAFPPQFLKGEGVKETCFEKARPRSGNVNFCYELPEEKRKRLYYEKLQCENLHSIVIFPERRKAELFWEGLPEELKEKGILWLTSTSKKKWEKWEQIRQGKIKFAVGTGPAVFLPFPDIKRIIVDDESNPVYMSARYPYVHIRTFAGIRSQTSGAELILGGTFPSSRVYKFAKPVCSQNPSDRLIMVDKKRARMFTIQGVTSPLAISDVILRKTQEVVNGMGVTLWILDRLGYANAILCSECDYKPLCKRCNTPLRWEESKSALVCPFCKEKEEKPIYCPRCGAPMMMGERPGVEASVEIAKSLIGFPEKIHLWHGGVEKEKSSLKKIISNLKKSGGIVAGSRKVLAICDEITVSLICWLDVDTETARPVYDARFRAIKMVWDSLWCGRNVDERTVILQSKRPGVGWQKGLKAGWDVFWKSELEERMDLELPPWIYLVEASGKISLKKELLDVVRKQRFECMDPEPESRMFWIKIDKESALEKLRQVLEPFFRVSRSRKGYPQIRIWMD